MNLLEVKKISASYNGHTAIENVSFNVKKGEYVCLVGKNGSGKSTLLKTLVGLNKKDSGEIVINVSSNNISYLGQNNLTDVSFPATAKEIIMTGVQEHGKLPFYSREDHKNFDYVCKLLNIEHFVHRKIGELSGGQRQRVMLARALIRKPELLILDEPCSGLDVNITKELYDILDKLNKEQGLTLIMATHDLDEIKSKNVRVIYMDTTVKYDGNIENWEGMEK